MSNPYNVKVQAVNDILERGEPDNLTYFKRGTANEVSYKAYAMIQAMNEVFGVDGWAYQVPRFLVKDGAKNENFLAQVELLIRNETSGQLEVRATAFGDGNDARGSDGDGLNSAITQALKKCLWSMGVAERVFSGALDGADQRHQQSTAARGGASAGWGRDEGGTYAPTTPPAAAAATYAAQQPPSDVPKISDTQKGQIVAQMREIKLPDGTAFFRADNQSLLSQQIATVLHDAGFQAQKLSDLPATVNGTPIEQVMDRVLADLQARITNPTQSPLADGKSPWPTPTG